jgi:hypothetical protein
VFVHEITRPALQLMRPIDRYGVKLAEAGLATQFIWLSADRSKTEQFLSAAKNSLSLQSPVSISLDGAEGPGSYGLNRRVTLTVLLTKQGRVAANFALVQPNETDAPQLLAELAKLMGKQPPSAEELRNELGAVRREMARPAPADRESRRPAVELTDQVRRLEEQVARLQRLDQEHHARAIHRVAELEKRINELIDSLNEARAKIAKLEGGPAPTPLEKVPVTPVPSVPARDDRSEPTQARAASDPELRRLMRRMIQQTNDEAAVQTIASAMTQWAGDDTERRRELAEYCKLVVQLGYGNEPARSALQRLAGSERAGNR